MRAEAYLQLFHQTYCEHKVTKLDCIHPEFQADECYTQCLCNCECDVRYRTFPADIILQFLDSQRCFLGFAIENVGRESLFVNCNGFRSMLECCSVLL